MKNRFYLITAVILLLPCTLRAQWSVGLLGGAGYNVHSQDVHYMTDYRILGAAGLNFGLTGQYDVTDWFGLRMDATFTQKNYRHTRADLKEMDYRYRNDYLLVPVLASFRFGGARLKGFANAGVYGGWWLLCAQRGTEYSSSAVKVFEFSRKVDFNTEKDNRLDLGLAGGLGLEYGISRHWAIQLEARGYYSLASQVKQYMQVKDYRYDTTVVLQAACLYRF